MQTKEFKPLENETDEQFRKRVHDFADKVVTLTVEFIDDVNRKATRAKVTYFD